MSDPRRNYSSSLTNATTASTADLGTVPTVTSSNEPINEKGGVGKALTNTVEPVHNGKRYLTEAIVYEHLAYAWSTKKKWFLLTIVAVCQTSE